MDTPPPPLPRSLQKPAPAPSLLELSPIFAPLPNADLINVDDTARRIQRRLDVPVQLQPPRRERRHKIRPVLDRLHVQMLAVIVHRMPHPRERRRDHVQHLDAARQKWDVVVLHHEPVGVERLTGLVEPAVRRGLVREEEARRAHAGLESRHVRVRPVCGFEVGGNPRAAGAEQVEEEEEVDGGEVVLAGGEGGVVGAFPGLC